jgi:hypothetical protein
VFTVHLLLRAYLRSKNPSQKYNYFEPMKEKFDYGCGRKSLAENQLTLPPVARMERGSGRGEYIT